LDNQEKGNPKKMKKNRYSPEQIIYALKQGGGGEKAVAICQKMGVSIKYFKLKPLKLEGANAAVER
jgi:hypothetical protein